MFRRIRDYYNEYETAIPRIFRYQFVTKVILIPAGLLSRRLFRWILTATGIGSITNTNWLSVLLHPAIFLLILLAAVLVIFYTVFDVNAMILLSVDVLEGRRRSIFELIRESVKDLRLLRSPAGVLLLIYLALARPITGVGISLTITKELHPLSYLLHLAQDSSGLLLLLFAVDLLILIVAFMYLYSMHFVLLGGEKPLDSFACSRRLIAADKWGAVKAYFFMIVGIALPADLLSVFFRVLLPYFLMEMKVPIAITFAVSIFGILVAYTCSMLVAPLQILRLTEYYLSHVQPERMIRPKRDKRTWFYIRVVGFTAVGLLVGFSLSNMLPLFRRHLVLTPYKGILAEDIGAVASDTDQALSIMKTEEEEAWHFRVRNPEDSQELALRAVSLAVREKKTLFIELFGTESTKENVEKLCRLITLMGAENWIYIIMESAETLRAEAGQWPDIRMGLRIRESYGDVGTLKSEFFVFSDQEVRGSQIADLQKDGFFVCLDIENPETFFVKFTLLEAYPDCVFTKNTEDFRMVKKSLETMKGDEWLVLLITEI